MKRILLAGVFAMCVLNTFAQNLVTNGNFEQYISCPTSLGQPNFSSGWSGYTLGTPDYFNTCGVSGTSVPTNTFGYQPAAAGNAYAGLFVYHPNNYREYLKTNITQLQPGYLYEVSMYVSLADGCSIAANGLGVYFYHNNGPATATSTVLPVVPQISYISYGAITNKTGWTKVTATFAADSAYNRMIIGSFTSNTNATVSSVGSGSPTSYYYIDSVEVKPVYKIVPAVTDTVFCLGDSIHVPFTLTTQNYFTNNNIFTLQLSDSNGSFTNATALGTATTTQINAVIPANTPAGSGYHVRIVASSPYHIGSVSTKNILVKNNPTLSLSSNSPVCAGSTLTMQATSNATAFTWSGAANSFTGKSVSIPNADSSHTDHYIVTATLNGCSSKDTLNTTVYSLPAKPSVVSNSPVCFASSIMLTATCSTPNVTYTWIGPNASSSTAPFLTINNAAAYNSGVYIITATKNNCTSIADSVEVLVKDEIPKPSGTSNSPICIDETLLLTASGAAGLTFNWVGVNNFNSNSANPGIQKATLKNSGLYTLTASVNGCTSEADSIMVTINPPPTVCINATPGNGICAGTTVIFNSKAKNTGSSVTYQWYKNAKVIAGATAIAYSSATLTNNDAIYCIMYTQDMCGRPQVSISDTIVMSIADTASPKALISSYPAIPMAGKQDDFTVLVKKGGTSTTYQWQVNGNAVPGAIASTWSTNQLKANDKVSCIITSPKTCVITKPVGSDTLIVKSATGIADVNSSIDIVLYPNPNNGTFTISGLEENTGYTTSIINSLGLVVYTNTSVSHNDAVKVDAGGRLPLGMYILNIQSVNSSKQVMLTIK